MVFTKFSVTNKTKNMKFFSTLILVFVLYNSNAQHINWISFEEAIELNKKEPKKILIDVYTDWCGYCKKMDRDTYENEVIAEIINQNFYAVKLDAEQKKPIVYKGKSYNFIDQGRRGYNEFAANLLHGEMSYPSTVFMDASERLMQKLPGYFTPQELEPILIYFGEDRFTEISWEEFQEEFVSNLD